MKEATIKPMLHIVAVFLVMLNSFAHAQAPTTLSAAVDAYIQAAPENEASYFNNVMKILTKDCSNDTFFQDIKNGKTPEIHDLSEVFNFDCIRTKIFNTTALSLEKRTQFLHQVALIPAGSNVQRCVTDATCPSDTSCLPVTEDDFSFLLEGKGDLLTALQSIEEERATSEKNIAYKKNASSCSGNHECQSLLCQKTSGASLGVCQPNSFCRLGRNLEKVKADGGGCENGLKPNERLTCLSPLNDENLLSLYKGIKTTLEKNACGEFSDQVGEGVSNIATDLRSFELMMLLGQNLQKDLTKYRGANRYHYHQIPKRIQELFLTQYLEEKENRIKKFNAEFSKFTQNFASVITSDGKSTDQVNFFDKNIIQKEMHSQKATATYYLQLYGFWINTQQKFHQDIAHMMQQHAVTDHSEAQGLMAVLHALGRTTANSDNAPLFKDSEGKKNKKRWFLALKLPGENGIKEFKKNTYVLQEELDLANFRAQNSIIKNLNPFSASNWYWNFGLSSQFTRPIAVLNYVLVGLKSINSQLLDPILPPNGCNIINNTANECGSENDSTWDWYTGTNGTFHKEIPQTLEKLYKAWLDTLRDYYKQLAKNKPANYIIDPELNLYAGCIQEDFVSHKSNRPTSSSENLSEFYKNFCVPDLNKNGKIEDSEYTARKTLENLAKKILSYSLAYSYNANKRSSTAGVANSYQDEFAQDESTTLVKKPDWIDTSLTEIDPATKFYQFKHGNKKKFLNRIRNKYFFMTQLYFLLAKNYDKQIKCVNDSYGDYGNQIIVDTGSPKNSTPPVITPNNGSSANPSTPNNPNNTSKPQPSHVINNSLANLDASKSSSTSSNSNNSNNLSPGVAAQKTHDIELNKQENSDEKSSGVTLGGVDVKTQNVNSEVSFSDKKAQVANYNPFASFDSLEESTTDEGQLSPQEQDKVQAALNSNQEPQFSDQDTLFTQITKRYIKSYRTIFRSERRSSAQ